jgi:hypothetical protein
MRESRTYGSVRGAQGNLRPYRDRQRCVNPIQMSLFLPFRNGTGTAVGLHIGDFATPLSAGALRHQNTTFSTLSKLTTSDRLSYSFVVRGLSCAAGNDDDAGHA